MDVAVDAHGHQSMPVLHLDVGDVADVDVGDPHPGVLLNHNDVGQLRLNGVRPGPAACGSGQPQRVEAPPFTPGIATGTPRRAPPPARDSRRPPGARRGARAPSARKVPGRVGGSLVTGGGESAGSSACGENGAEAASGGGGRSGLSQSSL